MKYIPLILLFCLTSCSTFLKDKEEIKKVTDDAVNEVIDDTSKNHA
jgi:hypothetical protein